MPAGMVAEGLNYHDRPSDGFFLCPCLTLTSLSAVNDKRKPHPPWVTPKKDVVRARGAPSYVPERETITGLAGLNQRENRSGNPPWW